MGNPTGRTPRDDRESVAETTLTIRLTRAEKEGLERLVAMRQAELREAYGAGAVLSMAGLIRSMIVREVGASFPQPVESAAEPAPLDADSVRERVESAIEARTFGSAAELAREAGGGVTPSDLTRLKAGKQLGEGKLSAIDAALTARGA